jgi:glycerol-3-phosphate acyltransferase PlsY
MLLSSLLLLALGYLLGSMPNGYLAGRWLKGIDLRQCGSGSTGATNVLRNVGKGPALVVFLLDVGKGALAVLLAKSFGLNDWVQVLAGLAALAGHIWPVWLGWKGGKAVATGLGMFLGLAWPVGLACFGVVHGRDQPQPDRVAVQRGGRHRSAGADAHLRLAAAPTWRCRLVASLMVLWRHRSNIERLLAGTEPGSGRKRRAKAAIFASAKISRSGLNQPRKSGKLLNTSYDQPHLAVVKLTCSEGHIHHQRS